MHGDAFTSANAKIIPPQAYKGWPSARHTTQNCSDHISEMVRWSDIHQGTVPRRHKTAPHDCDTAASAVPLLRCLLHGVELVKH